MTAMEITIFKTIFVVWSIWTAIYVVLSWDLWKSEKVVLCTIIAPYALSGLAVFNLLMKKLGIDD